MCDSQSNLGASPAQSATVHHLTWFFLHGETRGSLALQAHQVVTKIWNESSLSTPFGKDLHFWESFKGNNLWTQQSIAGAAPDAVLMNLLVTVAQLADLQASDFWLAARDIGGLRSVFYHPTREEKPWRAWHLTDPNDKTNKTRMPWTMKGCDPKYTWESAQPTIDMWNSRKNSNWYVP